jgi:hypothetical protein
MLGAVSALALAGCSDGAGAQPGPSKSGPPSSTTTTTSTAPSSTATTSASPSGTATVAVPAAARAHTEDGAKAFAKYFYETAAKAYVTSSPTKLRALYLPSCVGCGAMTRAIDKQREAGEHFERETLAIELVEVRDINAGRAEVDVAGTERSVRVVNDRGEVTRTTKQGVVTFRTDINWTAEGWRVATLTLI